MTIQNFKHVHFIGVGGIGVSALARLCKLMGLSVSGTDMRQSVVTDDLVALGCDIKMGHGAGNVPQGTDLVVHTEDVNEQSSGFVELTAAKERQIQTLKYSQALGLFIEGFTGVGVSGTNGKSTTTAILGYILAEAGLDPMVVLGSRMVPANESEQFKGNARFGQGKYFVYEADEYHRHMLDTRPKAVVLTNIEEDHLDYYKNLEDIETAFGEYVTGLPQDGLLVFNMDDKNTARVCANEKIVCKKVGFGLRTMDAKYSVVNIKVENQRQLFDLIVDAENLGQLSLALPGDYNIMNTLAAVSMAMELGVEFKVVQQAVEKFAGIWRRFETVGQFEGIPVISDYAHHPTALRGLIAAIKQFFPDQKTLLVFQPHQKNRTKMLFNDFVEVLLTADDLILPEIYFVPGREKTEDQDVSSKQIVDTLSVRHKQSTYCADLIETEKIIREHAHNYKVIILAGAGTIDQLARKLTQT